MKFQAGFCPNEARTLLSLCTYPIEATQENKTESLTDILNDVEIITVETCEEKNVSFEIGKCANGSYYLLFRAEDYTMHNIQEDLQIFLHSASGFAQHPDARIQKSFWELFTPLQKDLKQWIEIISRNKPLDLYVSGHGRAAAIATLCLGWLKQQQTFDYPIRIKAYMFGSPKVGNTFFTQELNDLKGAKNWCFNVRHSRDLIPFIPLAHLLNPRQPSPVYCFKDVGSLVLLKGELALHGTTLMGTFSKHRAQWYAHYLKQQFQSTKRLGFPD